MFKVRSLSGAPLFCIFSGRGHTVRFFCARRSGLISNDLANSGKTENSLFSHFATSNPPIYRQILRLRCVEDTPIPKFITECREAVYENAPLFQFGFDDKCTSINRLFRNEVTAISYSKTPFFIEPESSDLTKNARPFIMFPVSSGWRQFCRFPNHPRGRCPRVEKNSHPSTAPSWKICRRI